MEQAQLTQAMVTVKEVAIKVQVVACLHQEIQRSCLTWLDRHLVAAAKTLAVLVADLSLCSTTDLQ
jgi:hypothetical protein